MSHDQPSRGVVATLPANSSGLFVEKSHLMLIRTRSKRVKEVGVFIEARRMARHFTQAKLAKRIGIAQSTLSKHEKGSRGNFSPSVLRKLAHELKCHMDELSIPLPSHQHAPSQPKRGQLIKQLRQNIHQNEKSSSNLLGHTIRAGRNELGISIRELARRLNVGKSFVGQIELGQIPLSTNDALVQRLADVLRLNLAQLQSMRPHRRLKQVHNRQNPLSQFLIKRRLELHLIQTVVASRAGISPAVVVDVEKGRRPLTRDLLKRIARALHTKIPENLIPPDTP